VAELVTDHVQKSQGRISANRLRPKARAAGYTGSDRNFRRLVADAKDLRSENHRGRRPAVWSPGWGEYLVIDGPEPTGVVLVLRGAGGHESKGIMEHLCGYAQRDLAVPLLTQAAIDGAPVNVWAANTAAAT
jgi:hypothetical protein